jgi:Fe2+-dicitrate sensor, membrane component
MKARRFEPSRDPIPPAIAEQAAAWLAKRDRGLSAAEQDDYMQWLRQPFCAEAIAQQAAALERMMQLYEWQPAHDTEPNPDLFAPVRRPRRRAAMVWFFAAAAAAVVAVMATFGWRSGDGATRQSAPEVAAGSYLRVNERLALPDGSRVELKDGSTVVVQYSEAERRVRLTGGEAHFTVWKDRIRPFVVEAGGIEVRAVGTAFNVRLAPSTIEVLVTEGTVQVEAGEELDESPLVEAGERAVVPRAAEERAALTIEPVTAEQIRHELGWQAPRLQFRETPLADAVAEFNRLNRHQLVIGEAELGSLRIGGTFRPDNVEGFVRLLDATLDVRGEPAGPDRTVLRRRR